MVLGIDKRCPVKAHTLAHMNLSIGVKFDRMLVAKLFVYLDGGFKEPDSCEDRSPHSTWGVCIVAEYHDGTQVICLSAGGFLSFLDTCSSYCGEILPSNAFAAEVYANILARVIMMQQFKSLAHCTSTPIVFMYDSTSADFVTSRNVVCKSQPVLVQVADIVDLLCSIALPTSSCHVHSHDMHP